MLKFFLKTSVIILLSLSVLAVLPKKLSASWNCDPTYGGGEHCYGTGEIMIDKTVKNPSTGIYVNNLGLSDPKFAPGQEVMFRLEIKNIGQSELRNIKVRDVFPKWLQFNWFELGSSYWDANNREIRFEIDKLGAGDSKQYEISTKVYPVSILPSNQNVICNDNTNDNPANKAYVDVDGKSDSDEAKFCITNKVLSISTLPSTGVPFGQVLVLILLAAGLSGTGLYIFSKIIA